VKAGSLLLRPAVCKASTVGPAPEINAATPAARSFVMSAKEDGIWLLGDKTDARESSRGSEQ
jgi:hypothetical protein